MTRDFRRLQEGPFDLLVVGGGIYGAWVAYDAALRGLRVALVEREDWGAGTSSASSKLIHGGLRYLEYGRLGLVRKSLSERRRLFELGRHRVRALRFVVPVYSDSRAGRLRIGMGLWLYDRLGGRGQPVPRHESLTRDGLLQRYSFLSRSGLLGGFTFGDCQTDDMRFALEIVDGAVEAGVTAVSRAAVGELLVAGGRVRGARVTDAETGESLEVPAELTVNCAGPWAAGLLETVRNGGSPICRLTKGVHLVLPPLPTDDAFLFLAPERGRVVFLMPWYGRTLLGTTDTDFGGDPDRVQVDPADVAYLLEHANRLCDGSFTEADVIGSFAGVRTLPATGHRKPSSISRELTIAEPLERLIVPIGGKYTSARVDAASIVDRVFARLERAGPPCATGDRPFPWTPEGGIPEWRSESLRRGLALGLDEETVLQCQQRYGSRLDRLYGLIEKRPEMAGRIVPESPFCLGEVVHAARFEMARSLEDVLARRIPLLHVARLSEESRRLAASLLGEALGWSAERTEDELRGLRLRFR